MKLYHITFTYSYEVEANNDDEAEQKAIADHQEGMPGIDEFGTYDIEVEEVT